jgi:hypothetical protein
VVGLQVETLCRLLGIHLGDGVETVRDHVVGLGFLSVNEILPDGLIALLEIVNIAGTEDRETRAEIDNRERATKRERAKRSVKLEG